MATILTSNQKSTWTTYHFMFISIRNDIESNRIDERTNLIYLTRTHCKSNGIDKRICSTFNISSIDTVDHCMKCLTFLPLVYKQWQQQHMYRTNKFECLFKYWRALNIYIYMHNRCRDYSSKSMSTHEQYIESNWSNNTNYSFQWLTWRVWRSKSTILLVMCKPIDSCHGIVSALGYCNRLAMASILRHHWYQPMSFICNNNNMNASHKSVG
jgi:hypothetical protein